MPEPAIQTPPNKVTFDEAQQQKIDLLIREAQGRAASTVRTELHAAQARLTTLQDELQAAKDAAKEAGRSIDEESGGREESDRERHPKRGGKGAARVAHQVSEAVSKHSALRRDR